MRLVFRGKKGTVVVGAAGGEWGNFKGGFTGRADFCFVGCGFMHLLFLKVLLPELS